MRIVFLGSSHGVPEPHRRCSSTLIELGEDRYFIDMGSQSIEELVTRGISVESVKAIFITHMHGDHNNGLLSYLDLCSWYYKKANPAVYLPGDVEGTKAAIAAWIRCNGVEMRPFVFGEVVAGVIYDDGKLKVSAYKTKHTAESHAFLVEAEGKRVLFTGDLKHKDPSEDFPMEVLAQPLDLAICESAHFEATKYLPLFENNENLKKLCFNHYSDRFLSSVLSMKSLLPNVDVMRATYGMEIVL